MLQRRLQLVVVLLRVQLAEAIRGPEPHDRLDLLVGDVDALHALRLLRVRRHVQHVALAEQLLGAALVEDRPARRGERRGRELLRAGPGAPFVPLDELDLRRLAGERDGKGEEPHLHDHGAVPPHGGGRRRRGEGMLGGVRHEPARGRGTRGGELQLDHRCGCGGVCGRGRAGQIEAGKGGKPAKDGKSGGLGHAGWGAAALVGAFGERGSLVKR